VGEAKAAERARAKSTLRGLERGRRAAYARKQGIEKLLTKKQFGVLV